MNRIKNYLVALSTAFLFTGCDAESQQPRLSPPIISKSCSDYKLHNEDMAFQLIEQLSWRNVSRLELDFHGRKVSFGHHEHVWYEYDEDTKRMQESKRIPQLDVDSDGYNDHLIEIDLNSDNHYAFIRLSNSSEFDSVVDLAGMETKIARQLDFMLTLEQKQPIARAKINSFHYVKDDMIHEFGWHPFAQDMYNDILRGFHLRFVLDNRGCELPNLEGKIGKLTTLSSKQTRRVPSLIPYEEHM